MGDDKCGIGNGAGVAEVDQAAVLRGIAAEKGIQLRPTDISCYVEMLDSVRSCIEQVENLPEYRHPRVDPESTNPVNARSYRAVEPYSPENPLNAWSHVISVPSTASKDGLLKGASVAIKDNICIAGVPITIGTQEFHLSKDKPYPIPDIDAPVISRVLEAGGTIPGTSTCENYCMSARSCTSATGPVHNPWLKGHSAGGSSSGSAALVAASVITKLIEAGKLNKDRYEVGPGADMALGGDQGASIRLPAAYCGIYGLKPTHGLVPYTGIGALLPMIDHCGPIAGSVMDTAKLLTAIAGYDGLDPRMTPETPLREKVPCYHMELSRAIELRKNAGTWTPSKAASGMRVGILTEAFAVEGVSPEVASMVKDAALRFRQLGAEVEEVSVPLHTIAPQIFVAATQSYMADVFLHNTAPTVLSYPMPGLDLPNPDQKWYETMTDNNPEVVSTLFTGTYLRDRNRYPERIRAKALMHVHELRAAYDKFLVEKRYDVLLTPANPTVAPKNVDMKMELQDESTKAYVTSAVLNNTKNTCPFNISGHPGLVIPIGFGKPEDGEGKLPVGMQLIGRRWNESRLFLVASAWEVGGHAWDTL